MRIFHLSRFAIGAWMRLEDWLSGQFNGLEADAGSPTRLRAEMSDYRVRRGAFFGSLLETTHTRRLG